MVTKGISVDDNQFTPDSSELPDVAGCTTAETGVGRVPAKSAAKNPRPQHAYFVQCNGAGGPVKIGIAVDPTRRVSELRIGCPYPMQLLASCLGDDMMERRLHSIFAADRIHGEWFSCTPRLLELVTNIRREVQGHQARNIMAMLPAAPSTIGRRLVNRKKVTP